MAQLTPLNAKENKNKNTSAPVTVYPQNGEPAYTGYAKEGKTYADPAGTVAIPSGNATKTTYTDANGRTNTGYIIGGQTYTDPYGKNRAPLGSIVNTADGKQYQLTSYGGVETYPSAINQLKARQESVIGDMYGARNERNAGFASAAAAAERMYRERVAQLERDTQFANEQARKAYIEAQNPFGVIAQRNEALGLGDSGYAESTMAALGNEYQRQINENNRNKQDALAEIYAAIEEAKAEAEYEKAMNNAATLEAIAAQRGQNADSIMRYTSDAYNTGISMDRYNDETEYARKQEEDQIAYARGRDAYGDALQMLQLGHITPDVADALGMSVAEARAIYNTNFAPKPATSRSGGSSGSKKSSNPYVNENALFEMIRKSGEDPERWFMRNGSKYGISGDGEISSFVDAYNEWASGGSGGTGGFIYDEKPVNEEVLQASLRILGKGNADGNTISGLVDSRELIPVEKNGEIHLIPAKFPNALF